MPPVTAGQYARYDRCRGSFPRPARVRHRRREWDRPRSCPRSRAGAELLLTDLRAADLAALMPGDTLPDEAAVIEFCLLVAHYEMLATVIATLRIQTGAPRRGLAARIRR